MTGRPENQVVRRPRRAQSQKAEAVFDADEHFSVSGSLGALIGSRGLLWAFASRALRLRYKQTLLGIAWVVIQPALLLAVFVLVFGRAAGISGGSTSYSAFAVSSLIGWTFLSSSVSLGASALVQDATLIKKVYFPRELPVLGCVISFLLDLLIGFVLILSGAPLTGASLGWTLVLAPILVAGLLVPAVAIALPLAALSVSYRDFRYVVPFALQVWLFASPVAYPVTTIDERWRPLYALGNPAVGPLEAMRRVFALGEAPDWTLLGLSLLSGIVVLLLGYRLFKRLERAFADLI